MNQSFGQNLTPKTTAASNNNNAPKTSTPSGFLNPSSQSPAKPMNTLFGATAMASPTTKAPTSGTTTLFSWPNTSSPATTTNQFANFKSSPATSTTTGFSLKPTVTTAQSNQLASTTTTSTGGFNLGSPAAATTMKFGVQPIASKPSVITSTPNLTLQMSSGKQTSVPTSDQTNATAASTIPSLNLSATTTSTNLTMASKPVTTTSSGTQPQNLTFQQLEELILNKWTAELYEQEKVFLNQATQINIWDKIINENAEKLTQLHSTMEKVRKLQTKINDDLDVISTHQKDLEMCLVPMEKEDLLSVLKADPNRKNLYSNAKKIDSQIKSMSENLKETIEHINETSRSHDTDDPVIQVGRILNAHMESLRWIDEHTARMQDYFDSLLKVHDDLRRECDITKHDVY